MNPRSILMLVACLEMTIILGGAARFSGINVGARLAAPGGPSKGGNSISVAEAGPNPGGNSDKLMEDEDPNSIARAKAGPNPGGNSENVMESSDSNSVAGAKAGPNPGGNSLGGRKDVQQFRMSRSTGHANIDGRLFSVESSAHNQLRKNVLSF
ncbi:hypothetical protein SUGI_0752270 [Cryptomeria japonica]|uniref:uncharacterized protein LOC131073087 n=1 Tax=Cryptomeria japonica TaxID=3369 RepID=UPI002414C56C|nr:uncharacterized protein LOC131073087 [Cryptomeria japonica]GLJ37109.1 hypothetical protein SUGI_0752270 [Cryptomeria japonica]